MARPIDRIHDRQLHERRQAFIYFAILAIAMLAVIGVFLLALVH